ncbi:terpene synthase family protein [Flavitalea sp. BT771]|uniref:terpene synthase family protein n=1 Tax=Flavitalea sp. BT771 TaxID=3063329 RepID=UPI0026E26EA1|nr:terpene synthase family protein [Flavitalea sp. BT771]MDO6429008.1 terpene synthase family protein [Flavitalea sp. BT771]MDV6218864.1 terpene synthase family protein [Flavitalea sp. BT771]
MKLEQNVQEAACVLLDRIRPEYRRLTAARSPFSLLHLLSPRTIQLDEYCKPFAPHPDADALAKNIKCFCDAYGIWLPGAEHYITCAMYLFPSAPLSRIIPIVKNNVIDFYLNDIMGREVFPHLPLLQRTLYSNIKERMSALSQSRALTAEAKPIEIANFEMLNDMDATSTKGWFDKFLQLYCYHIELAHKDCNSSGIGYVLSPDEYFEQRCHVSGMPHTVMMIEYSAGAFLDWEVLDHLGIADDLSRLNWVVSLIGCLMNDLFSFEKEVIDNNCDSNLVMIILLNNPEMSLRSALLAASSIVRDLLQECFTLLDKIRGAIHDPGLHDTLNGYLTGLERCVQACWVWQVYTKRYKRPQSIWKETRLPS